MKQMLIMRTFGVIAVLITFGCGSTDQLATEIIYDAKVQIEAAKEAEAQNLAPQELAEAEQILARSEEMLDVGKKKEAYRLGMRAHLKAKIAGTIAIANQIEAEASSSEGTLELKLRAAEAAHRELQQAERELEELQSAPEE